MAQFQLGLRTSNVTSTQAILEIIAGAKPCWLRSLRITLATGVTGVFGLGRPAAAGLTPTSPVALLSSDGTGNSQAKVALAWATSPTSPVNFFERMSVPATIGAIRDVPTVLTQDSSSYAGILIPANTTLVLFNITGGPTLDVGINVNE